MRSRSALVAALTAIFCACSSSVSPPISTGETNPVSSTSVATAEVTPPESSTTLPAAIPIDPPLLVWQVETGLRSGGRAIAVWSDGSFDDYRTWGIDLSNLEHVLLLSSAVPTNSGQIPLHLVEALAGSLDGETETLRDLPDYPGCLLWDAPAVGYAFPTADPSLSFTICYPETLEHPVATAADAVIDEIREQVPSPNLVDPDPQSPVTLRTAVHDDLGHLVAGTIIRIDSESASLRFEVTEVLAGPAARAPSGEWTVEFAGREPNDLELAAIQAAEPGDPVWAVLAHRSVVSAGVFDPTGQMIDAGPGAGGLSLGNHALIYAAHNFAENPGLECQLDAAYRPPDETVTHADELAAVLRDWSVMKQRRTPRANREPDWVRDFDIKLTTPAPHNQWLAITGSNDTVIFSVRVQQTDADGNMHMTFDAFPADSPLRVWEINRQALEAANCSANDMQWIPDLLEKHGTLRYEAPQRSIGVPLLHLDLTRDN